MCSVWWTMCRCVVVWRGLTGVVVWKGLAGVVARCGWKMTRDEEYHWGGDEVVVLMRPSQMQGFGSSGLQHSPTNLVCFASLSPASSGVFTKVSMLRGDVSAVGEV